MVKVAYLLTGSNLGDRLQNLADAIELLQLDCGIIVRESSVYETAAWGKTNQPAYFNQALELHTQLNARQLLRKILKIEKKLGRIRTEKYAARIIDIDILLFESELHDYPLLTLPHPQLPQRRFALMPLAEIAASVEHPVLQIPIQQLLDKCKDELEVKKI